MAQPMRTNSPVDDPTPFQPPQPQQLKEIASDFAKLGKSRKYPEVQQYMKDRREFYQRFLPGGVAVNEVPNELAGEYWKIASLVLTEIDMLEGIIIHQVDLSKPKK
jgi:hypothetical protein